MNDIQHLLIVAGGPRALFGLATFIAVCIAGWYSGDALFDYFHNNRKDV